MSSSRFRARQGADLGDEGQSKLSTGGFRRRTEHIGQRNAATEFALQLDGPIALFAQPRSRIASRWPSSHASVHSTAQSV